MKRAIIGTLVGLGLLGTGAAIPAAAHEGQTITDIVLQSGGDFDRNRKDFDILLNAVVAADLAGVLADPDADFTVLAPTDEAFVRLAREFGFRGNSEADAFAAIVAVLDELSGGDPIGLLTDILLYHVSPEGRTADVIAHTPIIETALGATILTNKRRLIDNEPDVRDPFLKSRTGGIIASNGVINPITRVLIPVDIDNTDAASLPSIADLVAASGGVPDHNPKDFDLLLIALQTADLVGAVADREASLTVLAPNDAAFIRLARDLGYHGRDEGEALGVIVAALTELGDGDPVPLLQTVLLYHVLPGELPVKTILESETLITLVEGATITPDVATRTLIDNDPNLRDPRAFLGLSKNFRAANGFITTINRVLIPVDLSTL